MNKLENIWVDIFRAGDHGANGVFSEADVQKIVDNYKPSEHEAPVVVGHPKSNGPAYGWVSQVRRVGPVMQAMFSKVVPAFSEAVEAERFKKRSVSLYKSANGHGLRHVGFLGALPPVVKGLQDITFSQEDQDAVEIVFSEGEGMGVELKDEDKKSITDNVLAGVREFFAGKAVETKNFSEADMTTAVNAAVEAAVAPFRTQLNQQATNFSEREQTMASAESKQRAGAALTQIKAKGCWVPAFATFGLVEFMESIATEPVTIEFGEGDKKAKLTQLEIFTNFMEQLGTIVPSSQLIKPVADTDLGRAKGVNDNGRAPADPNSMQLDTLTKQRMAEKSVDYGTAMAQIAAEKPDLTRPGSATAGAV